MSIPEELKLKLDELGQAAKEAGVSFVGHLAAYDKDTREYSTRVDLCNNEHADKALVMMDAFRDTLMASKVSRSLGSRPTENTDQYSLNRLMDAVESWHNMTHTEKVKLDERGQLRHITK